MPDYNGPSNAQVQRIQAQGQRASFEYALRPVLEQLKEMDKTLKRLLQWISQGRE